MLLHCPKLFVVRSFVVPSHCHRSSVVPWFVFSLHWNLLFCVLLQTFSMWHFVVFLWSWNLFVKTRWPNVLLAGRIVAILQWSESFPTGMVEGLRSPEVFFLCCITSLLLMFHVAGFSPSVWRHAWHMFGCSTSLHSAGAFCGALPEGRICHGWSHKEDAI